MKAARLYVLGVVGAVVYVWAMVTVAGCANEQAAKGHELYTHYCLHCHGESGKQNEGFNWSSMPDPKPKDLHEQVRDEYLQRRRYLQYDFTRHEGHE